MGWVQIFLAESQSRLYPHMRAKFGSDPTAGSKMLSFKFIIGYSSQYLHTKKNETGITTSWSDNWYLVTLNIICDIYFNNEYLVYSTSVGTPISAMMISCSLDLPQMTVDAGL